MPQTLITEITRVLLVKNGTQEALISESAGIAIGNGN